MTGEFEALWAALLAAPADNGLKLIAADWLADHDADPDLEAGLRWAAGFDWWPTPPAAGGSSWWGTEIRKARWPTGAWDREVSAMTTAVCLEGIGHPTETDSLCGCSAPSARHAVTYVGRAVRRQKSGQPVAPVGSTQ